jgi:hypothetical protein
MTHSPIGSCSLNSAPCRALPRVAGHRRRGSSRTAVVVLLPSRQRHCAYPAQLMQLCKDCRSALRHVPSQVIADAASAGRPVLFFCRAGKDRTGLLAALVLGIVGASNEQARFPEYDGGAAGLVACPWWRWQSCCLLAGVTCCQCSLE